MENRKARKLLFAALLGYGMVLLSGSILAFDAAADFSSIRNPNGTWSYGSSYGVGSTFIQDSISTQNYDGVSLSGWLGPQDSAGVPNILHNGTAGTQTLVVTTYQPGQLAESPGYSNEVSVIRWTAPFSGTCTVAAAFTCLSAAALSVGGSVDVHILHNGESIYDDDLVTKAAPASFSESQVVVAGDMIDFAVGNGGNGPNEDTTGVAATITPVGFGTADLGLTATVTPGSTMTYSNVIFTLVVTNGGPDSAIDVVITNSLPSQVDFVACTASTNGACEAVGAGKIIGSFPILAANETGTLIVTGQVLCSAVNLAMLTNTATVSSITGDPATANNEASVLAMNSNPLRKPLCGNTLSFTEAFQDVVACRFSRESGIFCEELMEGALVFSVTMPLTGVDISQFNQSTIFELNAGNFSVGDTLANDPHYSPGKTRATFIYRETNGDDNRSVGRQTVRLKWNADYLTVTITLKDADLLDSGMFLVLADRYDGHATGLITDAVAADASLGAASTSFDVVSVAGAVVSGTVLGRDGNSYPVSVVRLKGTAAH